MYFSYDALTFRYEPFPIGIAKPLMEESAYGDFVANFPPLDIFEDYREMGKPGDKFTLSEKENRRVYQDFVKSNPVWREFYRWIKSDDFVYGVMDVLRERHIDLGYHSISPGQRLIKRLKELRRGQLCSRLPRLRARFEFSALPADGGHLFPHTDTATKIVTLIVSIVREGEWNPAYGGGTDVNRPKDFRHSYNYLNRLAKFEDMEVLDTFAFAPNQAVIFIKSFNSWHSVRPMTGNNSQALRKTLTINIEKLA